MEYLTSKKFDKDFSKLSKKIKNQAIGQFEKFIIDPMDVVLNNHKLHGRWSKYRSINITGSIRAIYVQENNIVRFVDIGSHSELYS
jgi:addiction module RelE/StbE family toxin